MSEEQNKAVVREMVGALNTGDWAALDRHPGLYETRRRFPMFRIAFPDLRLDILNEIAEGDQVAMRIQAHGTHLGPFMGVQPTGKDISFGIVMMDELSDGKIVQHNANPEWLAMLVPLGIISPPQ